MPVGTVGAEDRRGEVPDPDRPQGLAVGDDVDRPFPVKAAQAAHIRRGRVGVLREIGLRCVAMNQEPLPPKKAVPSKESDRPTKDFPGLREK